MNLFRNPRARFGRLHLPSSLLLTLLLVLAIPVLASALEDDATEVASDSPDRLAWWREARFGLFVHWGPVSLKGTEIGWSRMGRRRGHTRYEYPKTGIPAAEYDNLYRRFDPKQFNASEWATTAKVAGMRYLVFTTKHHDGFANFDTKLTDYRITSPESPYGKDVTVELAKAFRAEGLKVGFYYSQPDWHHPDYRSERHDAYIRYLHGQVRELLTNYGKVDILWFDGLGGKAEDWNAGPLFEMIRTLQPEIVVNNRCGVPADFDTPEQRIGAFQVDRPWETCMTLCRQWAWKPDDEMKSLKTCIQTLVRVVGGDGNLLFNVGPMPDGRIEPRQVKRLEEMGNWLAKYGESIYGTRGGPFMPGRWGASTCKGNTIYVHLLDGEAKDLTLPPLPRKIRKVRVLTGGRATWSQDEKGIILSVAPEDRREMDTLFALEVEGEAFEIPPVKWTSGSLALDRPARASNVFRKQENFGPDKAFDDDEATRWATDAGTETAWLEVDLGEPRTLSRALILEAYEGRVQAYALERFEQGKWIAFHEGKTIGKRAEITFPSVAASKVRLHVLEASEGPTLYEFRLFGPKE